MPTRKHRRWPAVPLLIIAIALVSSACAANQQPRQSATPAQILTNQPTEHLRPEAVAALHPEKQTIFYDVSILTPQTQTVQVEMRLHMQPIDAFEIAMPIWRPGRYEVLNPAGTMRQIGAFNAAGESLHIEKITKSRWRVHADRAEQIVIRYELFADSLNDRTRHVDDTHAFLSGESVFLYIDELRDAPIEIRFSVPDHWHVATGLEPIHGGADRPTHFSAPDYDTLIDNPFEIGVHDILQFDVDGRAHEIVIWGEMRYDRRRIVDDFAKIVRVQTKLFGSAPYERYVFLIHAAEGIRGGTEHVNSTIMQASPRALEGSLSNNGEYRSFLGLVSHEFFHTWNVEQFRPDGLVPYDYDCENYTTLLWVVEGATSYYDNLLLVRAGLKTEKQYLDGLSSTIDQARRRPGRFVQPLADASFDAWIKFTKPTPDSINSTVSFYRKGSLVSLMLDMLIRENKAGERSLDDVMRRLYHEFPRTSAGYSEDTLKGMLEEASSMQLDDFFARFVHSTDELELESALAVVGLELVRDSGEDDEDNISESTPFAVGDDVHGFGTNNTNGGPPARAANNLPERDIVDDTAASNQDKQPSENGLNAYLGVDLRGGIVTAALSDGPASKAGIAAGDEIIAIDGRRFEHGHLDDRMKLYNPGDTVEITLFRRDQLRKLKVTLTSQPKGKWKVQRSKEPTKAQQAMYENWLGLPNQNEQTEDNDRQ